MNLISLDIRMLRSLLTVVETGSITEAARRLGRTQPAITLQVQRLEDLTGRTLLSHDSRRVKPTEHGLIVMSYAQSILRLHDELLSRMSTLGIEGHVILGTPDLYAASLLPPILSIFRKAFPRIQVELRCVLSTPLVGLVKRGEIDIALVTRMNDFTGGIVVHQEPLVWFTATDSDVHRETPVPLALLPTGNLYRDHAVAGLESAGRRWRIACISESISGLQAAVLAGMAVTVLGRSTVIPGLRELPPSQEFPGLPKVDLLLYQATGAAKPAARALHDYLQHYLGFRVDASGAIQTLAPDLLTEPA
jgi:DNA-binding transcriptional LysR family regulator